MDFTDYILTHSEFEKALDKYSLDNNKLGKHYLEAKTAMVALGKKAILDPESRKLAHNAMASKDSTIACFSEITGVSDYKTLLLLDTVKGVLLSGE